MVWCGGRRRTFAALNAVSACLLCCAAVVLFISVHDLVIELTCVITKLARLRSDPASEGGAAVGELESSIVETDTLTDIIPYLDFVLAAPAMLSMLFLFGVASFGFGCYRQQTTFRCAKCFVLLAEITLVMTFAFYLSFSVVALLADRPVLTSQWDSFTSVCTEAEPNLQGAINASVAIVAQLQSAGATPGEVSTAQSDVNLARLQHSEFVRMCDCLDEVPGHLLDQRTAALAGLVASILALVSVNLFCASANCCRRLPSSRVVPAGGAAHEEPTMELKEYDEEDELEEESYE